MRMLSIGVMFVLLTGAVSCIGDQNDQISLSFDSIFPSTPYKDALGSCMQVLGYLDQLCHEHERGEHAAFVLVHDAFLGKVVLAQNKVTHLATTMQSGAVVACDNVNYLAAIVNYINQLYQDRIHQEHRNDVAMRILNEISSQISLLIEREMV